MSSSPGSWLPPSRFSSISQASFDDATSGRAHPCNRKGKQKGEADFPLSRPMCISFLPFRPFFLSYPRTNGPCILTHTQSKKQSKAKGEAQRQMFLRIHCLLAFES